MEEEEEEVERENENEDQDVMGVVKQKAGAGKFNPLPLQTEVTTKDVALAFSSDKPKLLKLSSNFASDFVDIAIAVLSQGGGKNAPTLTLIKEFQSVPVDMCPREMVGAMVVQAALGSLAQQHPAGINKCPDWLVKVVFLTKVVDRATACLNELIEHYLGGSGEFSGRVLKSYYKLYGMLHAIMLILFNRVGLPSSSPRHFSCDGHQMIFLYLADENFLHFFALLVDLLRRQDRLPLPENELEDKNENKEANGQGSVPAVDENDAINATLWVAPALLVLDAMSQPLLVGHTQLSTDVLEMQKYLSEHKHPLGKRNCEECTMALARIKSKFNVGHGKQGDWARKGRVRSGSASALTSEEHLPHSSSSSDPSTSDSTKGSELRKRGREHEEATLTARVPEDASDALKSTLPLKDDLLDATIKSDAMAACLGILDNIRSKRGTIVRGICQASMLLLAHTTRDLDVRSRFREMNGPQRILHLGTNFPSMPSFTFTVLQQVLENTRGLAQAMETAMKLCLMRLVSRRTDGKVAIKDFVDCLSPLVYRDQRTFLQALRNIVVLYREKGMQHVFVELKVKDESASSCVPDDNKEQKGEDLSNSFSIKKFKGPSGAVSTASSSQTKVLPSEATSPRSTTKGNRIAPMSQVAAPSPQRMHPTHRKL